MSTERDVIERSRAPLSVMSIARDLKALGVESGSIVIAHAALSRRRELGYLRPQLTGRKRCRPEKTEHAPERSHRIGIFVDSNCRRISARLSE